MGHKRRLPKAARAALRHQRGRVSPRVTIRRIKPQPRRKPQLLRGDSPISDEQRVLLGDLRRQFHRPRYGLGSITRAEAAAEIDELLTARRRDG